MFYKFILLAFYFFVVPSLAMAQTCNPNIPRDKPDILYTFSSDGKEVYDSKTGLTWKRCSEGMFWDGLSCSGTALNFTWEEALARTSEGWRLPNKNELDSLADRACFDFSINEYAFPNVQRYSWSSSVNTMNNTYVWGFDFKYGQGNNGYLKNNLYPVRLVRGQPA